MKQISLRPRWRPGKRRNRCGSRDLHHGPAALALGLLSRQLIRGSKLPATLMALKRNRHVQNPSDGVEDRFPSTLPVTMSAGNLVQATKGDLDEGRLARKVYPRDRTGCQVLRADGQFGACADRREIGFPARFDWPASAAIFARQSS
jgi:hypothetical protein